MSSPAASWTLPVAPANRQPLSNFCRCEKPGTRRRLPRTSAHPPWSTRAHSSRDPINQALVARRPPLPPQPTQRARIRPRLPRLTPARILHLVQLAALLTTKIPGQRIRRDHPSAADAPQLVILIHRRLDDPSLTPAPASTGSPNIACSRKPMANVPGAGNFRVAGITAAQTKLARTGRTTLAY